MRVSIIALILAVIVLIVTGGWIYFRPINWSAASSAMAETRPLNAADSNGKRSPVMEE